jgi:hypothetical protein
MGDFGNVSIEHNFLKRYEDGLGGRGYFRFSLEVSLKKPVLTSAVLPLSLILGNDWMRQHSNKFSPSGLGKIFI